MGENLCFVIMGLALGLTGGCSFSHDCTQTATCSCEDPSFGPSHPELCSCTDPYYRNAHRDLCSVPDPLDGSASDATGLDASSSLDAGAMDDEGGGSVDARGSDASDGNAADVKEEPLPPPCDGTKLPSEDSCVIDATYGVFVSPLGSDTNAGTPISPFKTLGRALSQGQGKRVYACATAGDYVEQVAINAATSLFGGFDCSRPTWSYATTRAARVKPTNGIALTIAATSAPISLEDMEFDAPSTTMKGESSVAALVSGAGNVRLERVKLVAQDAQPGADAPATVPNYDAALLRSDPKIAGRSAMNATGGDAETCAMLCVNAVHATGGKGGSGSPTAPAGDGLSGTPVITPPSAAGSDGLGGAGETDASVCRNGNKGSSAPTSPGGAGASVAGTLTSTGWNHSADGAAGTVGGPGQGGGGGGGGKDATLGGGGGGACGGCGGAAGGGGKTGGSSFALLSYQSSVQLLGCTLIAGQGGGGGKGADGQVGQMGGNGGNGPSPGCNGGIGGQGGEGGGGGGGAGGLSLAIGYIGAPPGRDAATVAQVATRPALGGAAGARGMPSATKGTDGVVVLVQDLGP